MAKKDTTTEEVLIDVTQPISKAEKFIEDNQKSLGIILGSIIVIALAYWAYKNWYMMPREAEAQEYLGQVQLLIEQGNLEAALNGDDQNLGLIQIAEDYSGTDAANLAQYYAGSISLSTGKFEDAIGYLEDFSTDDPILGAQGFGMIGDAFLEIDQPEEAMEYYGKATKVSDNNFITPYYLMKYGQVCEAQGALKKAAQAYSRIKEEFGDSREAAEIDKYIERVAARQAGE